jgi:tetratricopeptide (TPR) repeat protein
MSLRMASLPCLLGAALHCGALPGAAQDAAGERGAADEVVRPFDQVLLKNGNSLRGTLEGHVDLDTATELDLATEGGSRVRLKVEDVARVVPRQTPEDVYKLKVKRAGAIKEEAARARAELALGQWCAAPLAELDGAAPRPEAAATHLLRAIELDPALHAAYPRLIAVLAAKEKQGPLGNADLDLEARVFALAAEGGWEDPELDFRRGRHLATVAGLPRLARGPLEKALEKGLPNQSQAREARALLARIHVEAGAPEKAIALHERAAAAAGSSPASFEPLLEQARLNARLGTPEGAQRARELFGKAYAIQPDCLEVAAELVALDYREGKLAAAEKALRGIVQKDALSIGAAIDLALVSFRLGKVGTAAKALAVLAPKAEGADRARAHLGLALAREAQGEAGARQDYEAALAADPTLVDAVAACAASRLREGDAAGGLELAEALLEQSAGSRPLFTAASRLAGEAELAAGRTQEALLHFQRAVEIDADDAALQERVGLLLLRTGRLDAAYQHLERARALGGERPDTLNGLGYYHYTRGDHEAALKQFGAVLTLVKGTPATASKAAVIPPARLYALESKSLIEDLKRLEVWSAELEGPDLTTLEGWTEVERFGIEIGRKAGRITLQGQQSGEAEGVTLALLDRPVDAVSFERVALAAKVDSGKARLGLRLEGVSARGGASTGLIFYRDFDGVLRCQLKSAQGDWEPLPRTEAAEVLPGKVYNPESTTWPADGAYHTLEIRRSGRVPGAVTRAATASGFDLFLDGQPVALNIRVPGMTGRSYDVGFSGQTDAVGSEYSISVQGFKLFRLVPESKKRAKF